MLGNYFSLIQIDDPASNTYELHNLVSSASALYTLVDDDGLGMAPAHRLAEAGPLQHGATDLGARLDPRIIKLKLKARGESGSLLQTRRAELLKIFRPVTGALRLRLTLPDGSERAIDCFYHSGMTFSLGQQAGLVQESDLVLIAPDPTFYNPTSTTVTWTNAQINSSKNITYLGSWESFPTLTIVGPLEDPVITHNNTGKVISLTYHVAAGKSVSIDLTYSAKTIKEGSTNLMQYLSSSSDLSFSLLPDPDLTSGINNITVSGSGTSAATRAYLTYYTRYIGL